jgi:short subunit dehydrogenase-like uncharacterized protein
MRTSDSNRPFDLLVYGATGYTGKKVAQYVLKKYPSLKVAIGGRNEAKLKAVADELQLSHVSVLVASLDQDDDESSGTNQPLIAICQQAKIVLACAGPYNRCGMPLVKAAIQAQTDYLDLCGEPQFFDETLVECEDAAREKGVLVVSACAFDCIPAELSACLVAREVRKRFDTDVCTGIEICHTMGGVTKANATTFHAAVDGFYAGYQGDLKKSRDKVTKKFDVLQTAPPKRPSDWPKLPEQPGNLPSYHPQSNTHVIKFPGADAAAIRASWRYQRLRNPDLYKDAPQPRLSVVCGVESKLDCMKLLSFGAIFAGLAKFKLGCDLLHGNPELFSNGVFTDGGPSDEELQEGYFCTYSAGYGRSETEIVRARCKGPEPGYVATPMMLVSLALTVLNHREKLAYHSGVVLPGALFGECQETYDILKENSIVFQVQQEEPEGKN